MLTFIRKRPGTFVRSRIIVFEFKVTMELTLKKINFSYLEINA